MALTPMDIYNKEFSKGFRGYDEEEVDMFLDQVVDEYEKLQKANATAEEKIQTLSERLEHYKSLEGTLKETLMTAQNTAEEVVDNARKKAALIIDSAQREARDIIERAGSQIEQAEKMDLELRKAAAVFKSRFVALLEAQLEFFRQETADINAQRNRVHSDTTATQAQSQEDADQELMDPHGDEPELAAAAGEEYDAPPQETEDSNAPLEEREEPLTPGHLRQESMEPADEQEQTQAPQSSQEAVYEERQPEPIGETEPEPIQDLRPEPLEPANDEPAQADDTDYFGTSQPPAEPLGENEEEIDDADALIREIQHYSALRNDEDTVSDEGFIIGRDD